MKRRAYSCHYTGMKTMVTLGYILSVVVLVLGLIFSDYRELPLHGFSAVLIGAIAAFFLALVSTILLCLTHIRNTLRIGAKPW